MTTKKQEYKNRTTGIVVSVAVHAAVLLAFLFITAWKAPNPPIPDYGIELTLGMEEYGGGEERPEVPSEQDENIEDLPENIEDVEHVVEEELFMEDTPEDVLSPEPVATHETPAAPVKVAPVVEKKNKEEQRNATNIKKNKSADEAALFKPLPSITQEEKKNKTHGDDPTEVADKGDEEGVLDAKALYNKQGGGGVGLDLAGWDWDEIPKPYIPHDESGGKIEFEIKVDQNGEIIGYKVLERSLSIDAERACRDAISQLTFTKKIGIVVPEVSIGRITFIVRTR